MDFSGARARGMFLLENFSEPSVTSAKSSWVPGMRLVCLDALF